MHALRLFFGWHAELNDWVVPMWVSWVGLVIGLYLASEGIGLARNGRNGKKRLQGIVFMRLPNSQGLLHEYQVFRNCLARPTLGVSGCVVGKPEVIDGPRGQLLVSRITGQVE